ncbi:hypothetical protein EQZ23_19485 [Sphingomonas sp. UV9]|uniref:PIN-like domain-containing protein n=1 Tax=Sphingomonas sp. UV9 TaxID=1851410 RepID=UPI000FFBD336|nr:hypothetical protein [Sphingomonas sp. UV9]RXD01710.1 hypothetical protein EQZ23_19485 [Sphingomonas sp. UV9]
MKLLVDNNLAPRLGRGLGALFDGIHEVVHIKDKFGTGSLPDEAWIEALGKEGGWCVLSADRRIAAKKPSRDLFLRSNLIGFFPLPAVTRLPLTSLTARILYLWPVLETTAGAMDRGCFEVGIKGNRLRPIA